jgi:phosphoribosylformylglycinamidine synthase II
MSLYKKGKLHFELYAIDILSASDEQLLEISQTLGLALNLGEMRAIKDYFSKIGRNPTDLELQTLGQTWSEHCFHKTFKGDIVTEDGKIQSLFKTYIAKVTRELNPSWCISVFEDNAGIIEFDKGYGVAVKVETHNHPSAIEPFGGAATGVGGVIRDVLGVWADPIACTDVLGFGPQDYDYERLPVGVKHPKYLFRGVVAGIGCYGNNMGIPTVNGAICFDESYIGNIVVYCGCIGLLPLDKFVKNAKPNDFLILAGGRTGRDGIHGVTFASTELSEKSEEVSRPAVQIANPIEEEKLKRAIIKIRDQKLGSAITDLGGGGLSSAVGETAHRFNCGAIVDLDHVSLKYSGLSPWEIYVSESQERMLVVVPAINVQQVLDIFNEEDVEAAVIGRLTEERDLRLLYNLVTVAELDMTFMFQPPKTERKAKQMKPILNEPSFPEPKNLSDIFLKILSSPNISSKESVIRTYDHEVKGNTTLKPLQGEHAGPNDAAVIKPLQDSWKGLLISCGINPAYGKIDAYWMAASAIDEAVRNNVAVGGRRIALLDNFTWGNPEKPERLGTLIEACKACYDIAKGLGVPFISGKDSLYNESPQGPITPTLMITAVGIIPDIRRLVSMELKTSGNPVYILGQTGFELGGSEYYRLHGFTGKTVPKVNPTLAKSTFDAITSAIDQGIVRACHDLSEGGLAEAAAEMAFGSNHGLEIYLKNVPRANEVNRNDFVLFSESNSRFLVEVTREHKSRFEELMKDCICAEIGVVTDSPLLVVYGLNEEKLFATELSQLRERWQNALGGA